MSNYLFWKIFRIYLSLIFPLPPPSLLSFGWFLQFVIHIWMLKFLLFIINFKLNRIVVWYVTIFNCIHYYLAFNVFSGIDKERINMWIHLFSIAFESRIFCLADSKLHFSNFSESFIRFLLMIFLICINIYYYYWFSIIKF